MPCWLAFGPPITAPAFGFTGVGEEFWLICALLELSTSTRSTPATSAPNRTISKVIGRSIETNPSSCEDHMQNNRRADPAAVIAITEMIGF